MDFFTPIVKEEVQHPNFKLLSSLKHRTYDIDEFKRWADGFVDRDNKIVKEFQTTFNSSFWEIYLYALFKEYGFEIDFSHRSPDFILKAKNIDFVVEATTANASQDKPKEWDMALSFEEIQKIDLNLMNKESIIRLSNSIMSKYKKYKANYSTLDHVKNKPFIIAVGPFEQPFFSMQYDRAIKALLYDYYVDEESYLANPKIYPDGPPAIELGSVEKDNGRELLLGFFNDDQMAEVSAIMFTNSATWAKASARGAYFAGISKPLTYLWASEPHGAHKLRILSSEDYLEPINAGLQIYHNPYAKKPLDPEIFRKSGVVQNYIENNGEWVHEGRNDALQIRIMLPLPSNISRNTQ